MNQSIITLEDDLYGELGSVEHDGRTPDPYVRAVRKCHLDVSLLRSWIERCETTHGPRCNARDLVSGRDDSTLLLIDVKRQCLVECDFSYRFVALSYVWGEADQFLTKRANYAELKEEGGLRGRPITQTIKDAMAYLWVDTMCIVQDDPQNKQSQIEQMASIYGRAILTIVALSGRDASSGLPGVSPTPRNADNLQIAPALGLVERTNLTSLFEDSVYHTRAWTFQERILSIRCLFFSHHQAYFQCRSNTRCEDRHQAAQYEFPTETMTVSKIRSWSEAQRRRRGFAPRDDFKCYSMLVAEYTTKQMRYPSDIVNAFAGIADALASLFGWTFTAALPEELLSLALLWTPLRRLERRETEGKTFPSWSWAGWIGEVHYADFVQRLPQVPLGESFESCVGRFEAARAEKAGADGVLCFESSTVALSSFRIEKVQGRLQNNDANSLVCEDVHRVLDAAGRCCGIVYGLSETDSKRILCGSDDYELLLLSKLSRVSSLRFCGPTISFCNYDEPTKEDQLFDRSYPDEEWCTLNVLLVQRSGGLRLRSAIAQVHAEAWQHARPQQQSIRLA
ncbi:heterokaryon incompatibility protein-domain-containing protein [Lineolata rhizophorae]|uniref:Heterokaryon incompatibility protein-domain-containing protein n=1 Tax=Lineolata rhizophorae TaxID=578093 RepID=A0A6A6PDI8_9PEZI|nr:heterokaryon incompatibility protein-domain-containing protein [Lineolata rhizophorae]